MTPPDPMSPPEANLRDFQFMPLQVARLRDSGLAAEADPEACWYALLLYCCAWHQIPAGSLPDNDAQLCKLIDLGRDLKTWKRHKDQAMRGWVQCSDGLLYHPVVSAAVNNAWRGKLEQRWRTECARIKKHNQRNNENLPTPTLEQFLAGRQQEQTGGKSQETLPFVPGDIASKGQGQGQGQGQREESTTTTPSQRASETHADDDARWDLLGITNRIAEAGAVSLHRLTTRTKAMDLVKGWLQQGIDVEQVILPTVAQRLADTPEESIGSLQYYAAAVLKAHSVHKRAERDAAKLGAAAPSQDPVFLFDGEVPSIAEFRRELFGAIGPAAYVRICHQTRFVADSDARDRPILRANQTGKRSTINQLMDGERIPIVKQVAHNHGFTDVW